MSSAPRLALVAAMLCATASGRAQLPEAAVPFSCEAGADLMDISREPGVRFEPIDREPPHFLVPRVFTFATGPTRRVRVYLSVMLPEILVGLGSEAALSVIVATWDSPDEYAPSQWWELTPDPSENRTSQSLLIDANAVGGCFGGDTCRFADLASAGDGSSLLVLGFRRELGGANAVNWELARLVLDFRGAEPRVAVAADCSYNEGGGACTALDSANMLRSELSCPWNAAVGDFECRVVSDQSAHREFQLLSGQAGPSRNGEAATMEDAANRLAAGAPGPVLVTGASPLSLIHEARLGSGRVILFASGGQFYAAERTRTGVGPLTRAALGGPVQDPPVDRYREPEAAWTHTRAPLHRASEIARSRNWLILRVVEASDAGLYDAPSPSLYWLGVERGANGLRAGALTLVSSGDYGGCGNTVKPTQVSSVDRVRRRFEATVTLQPPTQESVNGDVTWRDADAWHEVRTCRRPARIGWLHGDFVVDVSERACTTADEPLWITVDERGVISAKPGPAPR